MDTPSHHGRELDAAIAEFSALRQEALHYLGERRQLLLLSIVLCTAILGYASEARDGYIASVAMFVSAGCMIMCLAGFNAPQRIGAYIRTFIESRHPGFYWESALRHTFLGRSKGPRVVFGNRVYVITGHIVVFTALAVISAILTFTYAPIAFACPVSIAGLLLVLAADVLLVYLPLVRMRRRWAEVFDSAYRDRFGDPDRAHDGKHAEQQS